MLFVDMIALIVEEEIVPSGVGAMSKLRRFLSIVRAMIGSTWIVRSEFAGSTAEEDWEMKERLPQMKENAKQETKIPTCFAKPTCLLG